MVIMQNCPFEICRKAITVSRNEEGTCEWSDTHYAVRTHKGIHFYEFSHNVESLDKRLDCVESFVSTPTASPSTEIYDCKLVRSGLKNRDISEIMLDTAMWGHSDHLINEMTNVVMFQFSPPGLIRKKMCALAILNNIGYVEMYTLGRNEWVSVLDLSSCVKDQFEESLKQKSTSFSELKNSAYNLATCSIGWASKIKNDYCYFVTCQKSGVLLFWIIQCHEEDISAKFCGKIELDFGEIFHTKWITKTENKFMLFCCNILGQVMLLECQINKKHVTLLKSHMLWEQKDRMITKFSEYQIEGDRILIFYNKHRHLVAQLIDESSRILSQSIDNINDYRITSLAKNDGQIYVTIVNFKLYRIHYCIGNDMLKIKFDPIDIKDISSTMELYSVRFSPNGVICALNGLDRRVLHKKDPLQMETIFLQVVSDKLILDILLDNPSRTLTNYWDCIELLRFKIVKLKSLPSIDLKTLLAEGETDIYKLKLYLIFLKIYRSLVSNIKMPEGYLPKNSIEEIKDKILMMQAKANIMRLYDKNKTQDSLNHFEMECFAGSKNYLQFYSKKYETALAKLASADLLNFDVNEFNYICQCCDEPIENFSCQNGHANIFCSLTFTPIDNLEYISCKYCNTVARLDTYSEKPLCVFCDSYLEIFHFCV